MPISNKSSQNRMTTTTIRVDSREAQRRQQVKRTQPISNNGYYYESQTTNNQPNKTRTIVRTESPKLSNTYTTETPPLYRESSPSNITRGSPRLFRVKRVSRGPQIPLTPPPEQNLTTKTTIVKDTISRGTTPPPSSFYDRFPQEQSTYYPTSYQMRGQQAITNNVRYRSPTPLIHPTATTSDVIVQQNAQTNGTTTTKTSTRIIDSTTMPSLGDDEIIEETKTTTTIIKPVEIPIAPAVVTSTVATVPAVTTVAPVIDTTIRERPSYRTHRRRRISTISTSPLSFYTTSSTNSYTTTSLSTITPRHHVIQQRAILPPRPPIQTTIINDPPITIVPEQRYIHRARRIRTYSGNYSEDLDYGKRKVYKSDYKYRHYYYCNYCKGRCDLPNSSCGCCEWFYGCPLWALILLILLFLALIAGFFTLLGLQPTINPTRYSETAQTRVLNRTQIIYGFLQNCGSQANTPTTLALCANTQTTSTTRIEVTSYYTLSNGIKNSLNKKLIILSYSFWIYFYFFFVNLN